MPKNDADAKAGKDAGDFLDLLVAAMTDAATTGELTQLQTKLIPPGTTKERVVRIIVVPEDMQYILGGS